MRIIKSLEESGLLIKAKMKQKNKIVDFLACY